MVHVPLSLRTFIIILVERLRNEQFLYPLLLVPKACFMVIFNIYFLSKLSSKFWILHRCHFATFKQCQEWVKRLNRAIAHPSRLEDLFALAYHAWCLGASADDEDQHVHLCRPGLLHQPDLSVNTKSVAIRDCLVFTCTVCAGDHVRHRMEMEVRRMGFDTQNVWRVSDINCNYKYVFGLPRLLPVAVSCVMLLQQ